MDLKLFDLVRYTDGEIVFASSDDLREAYNTLKREDNILISFIKGNKKITKMVGPEILADVRNKTIKLIAEETI